MFKLGITISDDLDLGQHVSEVSSGAAGALGFLWRILAFAPRHTGEVAYKTLVRPGLGCAAPVCRPCRGTGVGRVEGVRGAAAGRACWRWRGTGGVGGMLDDLGWPSLGARREQSSLAFFCRIRSGAVDLDRDGCLTPVPGLGGAGASHESQCTRYFAYSDALRGSFFPRTIPVWSGLLSLVISS